MTDYYDLSDLEMLARDCLTRAGVGAEGAQVVARDVALAEAAGHHDSGFEALLRDLRLIRYGRLYPDAEPKLSRTADNIVAVDAGHGFAATALAAGLDGLAERAKNGGIAMLHLTRSSAPGAMAGALAHLAEAGLAAMGLPGEGRVHAIRPGLSPMLVLGTGPQTMLQDLLALAPPAADSPLDDPVNHTAWIVALDPDASAAADMMAHLPVEAVPAASGHITLAPELLAQIVNA